MRLSRDDVTRGRKDMKDWMQRNFLESSNDDAIPFHFLISYRMFGRVPIGILVAHFLLPPPFCFLLETGKEDIQRSVCSSETGIRLRFVCTFDNNINIVWTIVSHRCYLFGVQNTWTRYSSQMRRSMYTDTFETNCRIL